MLLAVYDPKGEMFEVLPDLAKSLVIQKGWSLEPPKPAHEMPLFAPVVAVEPAPVAETVAAPVLPGPGPL